MQFGSEPNSLECIWLDLGLQPVIAASGRHRTRRNKKICPKYIFSRARVGNEAFSANLNGICSGIYSFHFDVAPRINFGTYKVRNQFSSGDVGISRTHSFDLRMQLRTCAIYINICVAERDAVCVCSRESFAAARAIWKWLKLAADSQTHSVGISHTPDFSNSRIIINLYTCSTLNLTSRGKSLWCSLKFHFGTFARFFSCHAPLPVLLYFEDLIRTEIIKFGKLINNGERRQMKKNIFKSL